MPFKHYVATMPTSSINTTWLDLVGSNTSASQSAAGIPVGSWNLVEVIPMGPLNSNGGGTVMCYFVSGSY